MPHAIRFYKPGGPDVLVWEEIKLGPPGPGEARIRQTAVGLNFVDVYHRTGLYPVPMPSGLGGEGAGIVEEVGPGVTDLKTGDRVAYGSAPLGSYAEARLIPADRLIKLPSSIDDRTAAAMMLKGLTVQYLIRQTYRVKKATRFSSMPQREGSASFYRNGHNIWERLSSAPSGATRRRRWPRPTAARM